MYVITDLTSFVIYVNVKNLVYFAEVWDSRDKEERRRDHLHFHTHPTIHNLHSYRNKVLLS